MGDWEVASRCMRLDRHVVGVNGVLCVWPLTLKMKRLVLDCVKPQRRHPTLNMLWFWTVGCLVDIGYISRWILPRSIALLQFKGVMTEVVLFPTIWNICIPHSHGFHPFFSRSICDIHEQSARTLSHICETHLQSRRRWSVSRKCVNDLAPS